MMKASTMLALIVIGLGITVIGAGLVTQQEGVGGEFDVQSVDTSTSRTLADLGLEELDLSETIVFEIQREGIFTTQSVTDGDKINLSRLMTINSWIDRCEDSDYKRVNQHGNEVKRCADGLLQTEDASASIRNFLQGDMNQLLQAGSKLEGQVMIAEDALLHLGKIVGIESFVVDENYIPTDLIAATYTESGIQLSVKKVTPSGLSTVYAKNIDASRDSSLGIGLSSNGTLFFEVDDIIYSTDYTYDDMMYVSVMTHSKGVGLKHLDFQSL